MQKCCSTEELLDEFHRCVPPAGDSFHKRKIEMIFKHRYRQALSKIKPIVSGSTDNYNTSSLPLYIASIYQNDSIINSNDN